MTKIDELLFLIKDCNVVLEHQPMPDSCNGHFYSDESIDLIIINESIIGNKQLYKAVLAEEVGHYFTCIGTHVSKKHMNYKDRIELDRFEEKALKWACDFLIPTEDLIGFITNHHRSDLDCLSDYFDVSVDLLLSKFRFMSYIKHYWKLSNGYILVLSGLPGIYIMQPSIY